MSDEGLRERFEEEIDRRTDALNEEISRFMETNSEKSRDRATICVLGGKLLVLEARFDSLMKLVKDVL